MGKNSAIEWTHHTFNPWWGCAKVSPACRNCYAERWSKRLGSSYWGPSADRRFFGEKHWREPLNWNKQAEKSKTRKRVFCASMADVFEDRKDLNEWRTKLWNLVVETKWLDWLILTKRTENIDKMVPWQSEWPDNVWMGTTVENQEIAAEKIPYLIEQPAKVRFISCEPLLGSVDIKSWLCNKNEKKRANNCIDWVIVGGESGPFARPTHPDWVRCIRDQCIKSKVPFHFKQWGSWQPSDESCKQTSKIVKLNSNSGESITLVKKGKKTAGRALDGRTWDDIPLI